MEKNKIFDRPILSPKYTNQSVIARKLVDGFLNTAQEMFSTIPKRNQIKQIVEVGAGEGHISEYLAHAFSECDVTLTDIFQERLDQAKDKLKSFDNVSYKIEDICNLSFQDSSIDLVACCEVLEHIPDYLKGLSEITRVLKKDGYLLLSVPREPIWRVLNMVRGKYLKDFGNTPTHVNHWSSGGIQKLVEENGFKIIKITKPLPWTFVLSQKI